MKQENMFYNISVFTQYITQTMVHTIIQKTYRSHMDPYMKGYSINEISTDTFWNTGIKYVLSDTNI